MSKMKHEIQKVAQEIYDTQNSVSPSDLIDAVRDTDHPAHNAFTWDDEKAADEYRLNEARRWLREIVIVRESVVEQLVHVNVAPTGEGVYKPASVVVQTANEFDAAMKEAIDDLRAAYRRVEQLRKAAVRSGKKRRISPIKKAQKELQSLIDDLSEVA